MKNIFENAYFGKPYRTRDNKKALYQRSFLSKYIEPSDGREQYIPLHTVMTDQHVWQVDDEGKREDLRRTSSNFDIVSEWYEEISEEELNKLATKNTIADLGYEFDSHDYTDHSGRNAHWASYREGWKNAYRKVIKEYGSK